MVEERRNEQDGACFADGGGARLGFRCGIGIAGIVVGRGSSVLVRVLAQWPTDPSPLALVASVSISVAVGLTFGYYPAWRASRLDPIEALRYE